MTSTDRMLLEQIAIKLYEQSWNEAARTAYVPPAPWDLILRKRREEYRRRAGDMAKEIGV